MSDRTDPTNTRGDDVDHHATTIEHSDCCIVGGGPAGAVLALLLAGGASPSSLRWGMQLTSALEPIASVSWPRAMEQASG